MLGKLLRSLFRRGPPPPVAATAAGKARLSLILATRGRPGLFERFVNSVLETASEPALLEIMAYVDADDDQSTEYEALVKRLNTPKAGRGAVVRLVVFEPCGVLRAVSTLASLATGDIFIAANDDQVYETPGWDNELRAQACQYPDQIYIMRFNDGLESEHNCCFPIISRRFYGLLGYASTAFEHFCADTWFLDLGNRIGRSVYLRHVMTRHLPAWAGKAEFDATAARTRGPQARLKLMRDIQIYQQTRRYRELDAGILRRHMLATAGERANGMEPRKAHFSGVWVSIRANQVRLAPDMGQEPDSPEIAICSASVPPKPVPEGTA